MTTIKLQVLAMSMLNNGGCAITTRPSKENPSENGVHVFNAKQLERLCVRALGFNSPIALKNAIAVANGSATLSIQAEVIKAGDTYVDKATGETKIYEGSRKEGHEGENWIKYSNHELELGLAVSMKMFEMTYSQAAQQTPVYVQAPVARTITHIEPNQPSPETQEEKI